MELTTLASSLQGAEASHRSLLEEKERARALAEMREDSLVAERAKVQQLTYQLRGVESKTDTHKQLATVRDEELSRMRVRPSQSPNSSSFYNPRDVTLSSLVL